MCFHKRLMRGVLMALTVVLLPAGVAMAKDSEGVLQQVAETFEQRFQGIEVTDVRKAPLAGLYEVQVGMELLYVDESVDHVVQGSILDARTREDLTAKRLQKLAEVPFETLPLELAVKQVRGDGSRELAIFEDPNCPYCKRLHQTLKDFDDVTIYSFLFPVLSEDSVLKARDVWCADNPAEVWQDWMLNDVTPPTAECNDHPVEEVLNLGRQLMVRGTPATLFADGSRIDGAVPAEQIQARLEALDK